ncbi:MAG: hypothetical protein KAR21_04985, partial [Spirochaetales bacterium]|nr:hypothetical protein [Spirochaetales bacterium]
VFYYFEAITEGKEIFHFRDFYKPGTKRKLILYIDDLLISVENKEKCIEKSTTDDNIKSFLPAISLSIIFIFTSYIMILPQFFIFYY